MTDFYKNAQPFRGQGNSTPSNGLPENFSTDANGLNYHQFYKDGSEEVHRVCSTVTVVARLRETGGECGCIVEFPGRDGKVTQQFVPDAILHRPVGELASHLSALGLIVETTATARQALQTFVNKMTAKFAVYTQQSGWVENADGAEAFVLPDGTVLGAADGIIMRPDRRLTACTERTSLADWQTTIGFYARGNSRVALSICTALAAPLVHLINLPSGGFHFVGPSSIGKSTILATAASVWGNPDGYVSSWRTTDNAFEATASSRNDCLLAMDEMSQAASAVVAHIIYEMANGKGKTRMNANGSLRTRLNWRTMILSTGEEKAEAKIQSDKKQSNVGLDVRLANIPALVSDETGMFETLHEFATAKELADHLRHASPQHHGTAIRAFMGDFIPHKSAYLELINERCAEFLRTHLAADSAGQVYSVCHRFALAAVVGELAIEWGVLNWPTGEAMNATVTCFKAWLDERGDSGMTEDTRVIQSVRAFIGANQMSRFIDLDQATNSQIVYDVAGYRKISDGRTDYYVLDSQMHRLLPPGTNVLRAVKCLDKNGFVVREQARTTLKHRVRPLGSNNVLTYRINGNVTGEP